MTAKDIERLAHVAVNAARDVGGRPAPYPWWLMRKEEKTCEFARVRAILTALREPGEEAIEAGRDEMAGMFDDGFGEQDIREAVADGFRAVINRLLSDGGA